MSTMVEPIPDGRPRIRPVSPVRLPRRERFGPPLPVPVSSFVGREQEADAVLALLRQPGLRLMTLTGPGGVGKTRLAIRAAEMAGSNDFGDAATFVSLAMVVEPDQVVPTIARTLGIRETGKRPLIDRLVDVLRDRHLLLVLDNFEQVVDAAPLLIGLLEACPRLTILATSRAPLNVTGEHVLTIQPLALPAAGSRVSVETIARSEAIRLFAARAQAARHDFSLTDDNAADIAGVVRRLDGLPLAIELAAARIVHLTPSALLARLEPRLPLLTGGARDLPERQRTMAATIAWSHDLLTPDEQQLFRRLAVFAGGFTLDAAEYVGGQTGSRADGQNDKRSLSDCPSVRLPVSVLDGVASLVNNSLLRQESGPDGEPRYSMLDTVREYGLERLAASGEEAAVRAGHAAWFVALAERADKAIWRGPEHRLWLDRLEADFANLRSALTWLAETGDGARLLRLTAALGGLWQFRSHRIEGRTWLARALTWDGDTVPAARAMAMVKFALLEWAMGGALRVDLATEAVAIRRSLGDEWGVGHALTLRGILLKHRGDDDLAVASWEEAAAHLAPIGDLAGVGSIRWLHGMMALERGNTSRAGELLTEALALYQSADDLHGIARAVQALAAVDAECGETVAAAGRYAESLRLWSEDGSQEGLVNAIEESAVLAAGSHPAASTRLLAATATIGGMLGRVPTETKRVRLERTAAAARSALGEPEFAAAWAAGCLLTIEEATAEASAALAELKVPKPRDESGSAAARAGLTSRERDVLRQVAAGWSNRQIADILNLSERTVENHVLHILTKLDVPSRTAAAGYAIRNGLA
jgi:non-specific serine/threonine protein kinase